jgi:hypothetical protein
MRRAGAALLAAALTLGAAPAEAKKKANRFEGSCSFAVVVEFQPPLTNVERQTSAFAHGEGPCSGTFTDRRGRVHELAGDRVSYVAWTRGNASCGSGTPSGGGYLRYHRRKLRFALSETRLGGVGHLGFRGRRGGSADGLATISSEENSTEVLLKCAGAGLDRARVDVSFAAPAGISG